jgi:dTDP-4-amino-4,6-dideoxygalactose transaminase
MKVPMADLRAQHAEVADEVERAAVAVLRSGRYILGDEVEALERALAERTGVAHAVALSSGTDALLAALMALGVRAGDEVVTTAFSFFATAGAIARLGARPVFADVDASLNIDPADALRRVGPKTKCLVPVHLFGRPVDAALAQTGVPILEDAAQAFGSPSVARLGPACISFFPSKNLAAAGDAGALVTSDGALAATVRLLRSHGAQPKYVHTVVGGNFRMDALQAAILRAKLPQLPRWTERRRANALRYRERLSSLPLELPEDAPGHVWHHFVIQSPRRDALRAFLVERGVESEVYYPLPLHRQPCFRELDSPSLPNAERAAREVLALPVHAQLSDDQIEHVIASVRAFHG